ncbi:hypothetical protein [Candidatus Laterigemmans baculatus]|uniref:hypothetical protein n=1 Tax=Candidatus Laterigemmans baculatus TaxID=2770505 RepID=UPI0013DB6178|nr:hypothetical protein [Candidatus Laterigemmans baculatus]
MDGRWVEVEFDCLPLRSVGRLDIPVDASPRFAEFVLRVKQAIERHGTHNTYYLHAAHCTYHLTNDPELGRLRLDFEGTVLTDAADREVRSMDLQVTLKEETCDWLTEPIVRWFSETVSRAVGVEFNRYIAAGDLTRAEERLKQLQAQTEQSGGFLGMYL